MHTKQLIIVIFTWCWVTFVNAQQIQYISYPLSEEHLVPALTCESATLPTVTTGSASDVKGTSATCGGSIVSDGGAIITECGVCYSTTANPTIDNDKVVATGTTIGLFTCQLAGLTLNTTYYVRAYAVSNKGVSYGEAVQIHTDECDAKPDSLTFTVNNVSFKMILVEGGTFTMGSSTSGALHCEKPLHQVALSDYYMGETEVGQNLVTVVMNTGDNINKYDKAASFACSPTTTVPYNIPFYYSSDVDCQTFVDKLNVLLADQLQDMQFAMPTEAQWEYAARGGKKSKGYIYCGGNTIDNVAYYGENSMGYPGGLKMKTPNELGLYNMSGNMYEFCSDFIGTYSSATQINPKGFADGVFHVLRGGSWGSGAAGCRTSYRYEFAYNLPLMPDCYGLRLALIPKNCKTKTIPLVSTDSISVDPSLTAWGKVVSDGGLDITERGFCYATTENPSIADTRVVAFGTANVFSCSLSNILDNTTYYGRAYAINSEGISYGEITIFTNQKKPGEKGTEGGYAYVDLGLPSGLKWATCNIGATSPEGYGNYYSWAESATKENYSQEAYKYYNKQTYTYTKYITKNVLVELEKEDDVAHVLWGGNWRMPTEAEWAELKENCIWKIATENGVYGYRVSSSVFGNTNSIFLPAAGCYYSNRVDGMVAYGYYWSSILDNNLYNYARCLHFSSTNIVLGRCQRYEGASVRPVFLASASLPQITTNVPESITATTVACGGTIISNGGTTITECGVCYSTTANPTIDNEKVVATGVASGTYTCQLSNLTQNTTYYVRAYAINSKGISYGDIQTLTTNCLEVSQGKEMDYEWVNMGLSVMWGTCNVGASKPEDYGDFVSWGETSPKTEYQWTTYSLCLGNQSTMQKYCIYKSCGNVDNKTVLEPVDDVASVTRKGTWRIPTQEEMQELIDSCTWLWTTQNSVNGCKVTSKINGNSIFLPAGGNYFQKDHINAGKKGSYWTSSLGTNAVGNVPYLIMSSNPSYISDNGLRILGFGVRPVCSANPCKDDME